MDTDDITKKAIQRLESLGVRNLVVHNPRKLSGDVPVYLIDVNDWNPNEMDDADFNKLTTDMTEEEGSLQPILVVPKDDWSGFLVTDGEHRLEAARLAGLETIESMIVLGKDIDWQKMRTVRMNKLRGKNNRRKFVELLKDLSKRHAIEEIAAGMGYEDPTELEAMIDAARESLPPEMRKEFDEAKDEIKTVEDLSNVLNRLFTKYGDSLPYNFMVLDFGGKNHIWVRFQSQVEYHEVLDKFRLCQERGVTVDSVVMDLIREGLTREFIDESLNAQAAPVSERREEASLL